MLKLMREHTGCVDNVEERIWAAHRTLAYFNSKRLDPHAILSNWRTQIKEQMHFQLLEGEVLEWEREQISDEALKIVGDPRGFMPRFVELKDNGPGQNDSLFDWLETRANYDQMKWFVEQEVAGEAGFDDLAALTQIKLPIRPKLEVARNYWDEMGRGHERAMHGPMLTKLAGELKIRSTDFEHIVPETLALGNIMLGLAINRRYAYHSIGALGVVELTAPGRAEKVFKGLKRLGMSAEAQRYYRLHSTIDVKHSEDWNREVIEPLIAEQPHLALPIAEGALMRLNAGKRCFRKYKQILILEH